MTRSTIGKVFWGSLLALVGALVLLAVAGALAYANDAFVMDGPDVVGIRSGAFGWTMLVLAGTAVLVMIAAAVGQFVAWVGAVLNTAQLEDKTWFLVLLVTGVLSFGFVAMVIYLLAGPGDPAPREQPASRPEGVVDHAVGGRGPA